MSFLLLGAIPVAAQRPTTPDAPLRVFRDGDQVVSVQRLSGMPVLFASDWTTGRIGALMPYSGDTLRLTYIERGARLPSPELLWFGTNSGGEPVLRIREPGHADRILSEMPLRIEEVSFTNGGVSLTGLFVAPTGTTPRPGVVFLHGSGPATRGSFPSYAGLLASHGIASISYDKRGTGGSTGNWETSTLEELAGDGMAAVRFLRGRPEIDARRVGTFGTSQGPWLSAIMLAADSTLAFSVSTSGGGVTGAEQEIYRRVRLVADSGYSAAEVAAARELITAYFEYLKSDGRDSLVFRPMFARHASARWLNLIAPTSDPTVGEWPAARRVFARDLALPLPQLYARIRQPMLALFGEDDSAVPPSVAIDHLEDQLPGGRSGQLTTRLLIGANHSFVLPATAGDMPRLHPDYAETIVQWLVAHAGGPR